MVDEIKVGLLIATVTLTISTFFLVSAFQTSSALKANIAAAKEQEMAAQTPGAGSDLVNIDIRNPENSLRDLYEVQSKSELDRCLGNGGGELSESCEATMKLLYDTCMDPSLHISACDDPRLKQHFG